jgi:hypothetical protein
MSVNIGSVSLSDKTDGVYLGSVSLSNLNSDANSVLYSVNGSDIKGDNNILKFEEDIKKLTVSESMSYVSASPIGIETANNDNEFFTGILAQNKNSSDGSSTHLLITNDLGSDYAFYGGLDMFSSNSTVQYDQFGTMPNALGLSSQSSSIVITPNAGNSENQAQNNNIILTYSNGTKALILNNEGRLIIGANNPSYSGDTYGGDDGGVGNVLQSNGAAGLIWAPAGGFSAYRNVDFYNGIQTSKSGITIDLFEKLSQNNIIPELRMLFKCIFNFSLNFTNPSPNITFELIQIDGLNENLLQAFVQSFSRDGHHSYPINFNWVVDPNLYLLSFKIRATTSAGTISTAIGDYVSVEVLQLQNNA